MANSITANLMVSDMEASLRFYHERIGLPMAFTVDGDQNTDMPGVIKPGVVFASLRAGEAEMMLQERASMAEDAPAAFSESDTPGGTLSLYFRVDDVDEVVARLGEVDVVKPLQLTWYGMKEIWVRDPDGYVITVGTPEGPPPE
ncbi:MAG: VOC family protein [Acidimicrobiales bacterium]